MSFFKRGLRKGKRIVKSEENDIKDIWRRIRERDFSGNTGLAVKNSFYQFSTNLAGKIGSFIFTVILARLLMPELFGLYSLALSTILIFATISVLGIPSAMVKFISEELGKNKGKSKKKGSTKSYTTYFTKIIAFFILISAALLLAFSDYIANTFYQKPIFMALLAGTLYIIFNAISGFFQSMLQAANEFRPIFKREIIFQVSRIILVPLAVIFAIKYSLTDEINLALIILFLAISLLIASIFLFFDFKKTYSKKFRQEEKRKTLSKKQKSSVNKFIVATAALALSSTFFGNIDKVMLGIFVSGEFIGFYTAAFSLIGALTPLIGFAAIVLLPIFSRLKGKRLEAGFKKSIRMTLLVSIGAFVGTLIFAYLAILIVYGDQYLTSTNILRALSPLLLVIPFVAIYQSYYISQGNPQKVAKLLVGITILNVILNYILITALLPFGELTAVYGAVIATLISQFAYFGMLVLSRKK